MLMSLLHAWLAITVRADQIISGTIINILAAGLTAYIYTIVSRNSPESAGAFAAFVPPADLTNLPVIGWILAMFLEQGPIAMSVIVIVIGFQIWLFRSRWGLRSRAVGEHPKAAETVGIDVIRVRYRNVLYGGVLAGLAGAYLSMEASNSFNAGITGDSTIPVFQLPKSGTDTLRPALDAGTLNVTFDGQYAGTIQSLTPSITDTLSSFSSRGTHGSLGVVKPDVTAPGDTIPSALMGSGNEPLTISGDGSQSRRFVYVEDLADGVVAPEIRFDRSCPRHEEVESFLAAELLPSRR